MRLAFLICVVAAVLIATTLPASADCMEDVEALELGALQGEGGPAIDDATKTPSEKARAVFGQDVGLRLRRAEAAARAGQEAVCFANYQQALRILSGL
jgi:hypothetical protein